MVEPVVDSFYNSSFDLDVDFELTFDDLYFPSENESFFIPIDATNLEVSGDRSGTASSSTSKVVVAQTSKVEEEAAATYKTNETKRKRGEYDEKRNVRLIRNRESALLSRQRKKHYVEELEDKVKNLQSVITDLNSKVSYFMSENVTLKHKVGPGKNMYPVPYPWMQFPAYQVVPLLPIPRLKPQYTMAKVKKEEAKTKKVASVSVLGLLFCLFLLGGLAPIVNGGIRDVFYGEYDELKGRVLDVSVSSSRRVHCGRGSDQGVVTNGSELLVASLFVPRNEQLVKLDGNLTIHSAASANEKDSVAATTEGISSELRLSESTRTRDMSKHIDTEKRKALSSSSSDDSTTAIGEMQQWFLEGVSGPMFSSEMCTEVFQFDVSSTSEANLPASQATQHLENTTDTHKGKNNRRLLRGGLPVSDSNLTKDQNSSNKENFSTTVVVSVLVDPKEGTDGSTQSLSTAFIVVLVDDVKYVTYSCVLPRPEPHLVTT